MHISSKNERMYLLEIFRFFAAFVIFYGHYIHFYVHYTIPESQGNFYKYLFPYAGLAVPFFFLMSGAIFFHTYFREILLGKISFSLFSVKRIARLYPLHLATLLAVASFQYIFYRNNGKFFIYPTNDLKHFCLNLFFISNWGFENGVSFNGPVWSVSHEIFLYILFFIVSVASRFISLSGWLFIAATISAAAIQNFESNTLFKSTFAFFSGSSIYFILSMFQLKSRMANNLLRMGFLLVLYFLSPYFEKFGVPFGSLGPIILASSLIFDLQINVNPPSLYKKIGSFLGNISYSTYLIHFPVQLLAAIVNSYFFKIDFSKDISLISYIVVVLTISIFSYYYFELPMKKRILRRIRNPFFQKRQDVMVPDLTKIS